MPSDGSEELTTHPVAVGFSVNQGRQNNEPATSVTSMVTRTHTHTHFSVFNGNCTHGAVENRRTVDTVQ